MSRSGILLIILLLPSQLGCIWDRDTLASEIAGRQDAIKVIAGWFDRNPPEFYLMRLNRVSKELEKDPANLDLYDDAAVANDRLGNPDAAIDWIEKKKAHLHLEAKDAPQPNHHYRTLANLGTFHAHRWIKHRLANPAEVPPLDDLRTAEKLIAQAITENPDAHFGREKYQLMVIQWLQISEPYEFPMENPLSRLVYKSSSYPTVTDHGGLEKLGLPNAVEGISGMIELGAGWESVDLFSFLGSALQVEGRSNPSELTAMRIADLRTNNGRTIHPNEKVWSGYSSHEIVQNIRPAQTYYGQITEAADQRHQSRTAYLLTRLNRGEHPDTHPKFWNDWTEPEFPAAPSTVANLFTWGWQAPVVITCLGLIVIIILFRVIKKLRASRNNPNSSGP